MTRVWSTYSAQVIARLVQEREIVSYEAVVKDVYDKIENSEDIERKGLILSTLMKLKQICNHPAQFLQDGSDFLPRKTCNIK